MSQILYVTASARGAASHSTQVATALVAKLQAERPDATLVTHDFATNPLPHVGEDYVLGRTLAPELRSPTQASAVAASDALIAELFATDVIVIATPMYNFGIPSTLKAWIDHLVRVGHTFAYGANGAEGLVKGKKVYIVAARGGLYLEGPMTAYNFQDAYLKTVLGFIGITDVEVIPVEGISFGPEAAEKSVAAALGQVSALAA
ncbi:MAG TPA: FMN-dependent NADH-azoreductase [Aliidongia sp.]|uniref:FMN-dependent NADH-azoreductase n=1 Tax=Aliidongia sp. TaxID=1914230 RepID=UPI002DDD6E15|nr:FMN-dependent NADH-azoreductase [Aliidongia sp.]HEV2675686.1 FMN-dependent NADH-azoreductase [Aliidongia sp.]